MVTLRLSEKITTTRLCLQRLRYEDAEEIFYAYASKPEATRFVSWPTHATIHDTRSFLEYANFAWNTGKEYSYAIRDAASNRLLGSIGAIHDEGKVQVGYVLSPSQWGKGFATEACRAVVSALVENALVYRISSFVDAENVASEKVLLKSGFIEEARLGKWFRFVNQDNQPKDCILFYYPLPV